ncbi:sulfotransferase [Photorhabdus kleinii]|uniref:sulfotransferase n=1 Tax=Photorhabdus TaxID=29487 RepID=UPI0021D48B60|nr:MULTISPECIES: sulfotransferase [Photorhabdus]MCT8342227.1 sulfotransferase [Photorhabdus kleinii]MCW7762036.1 sulfotransferase [Photorhabdus luminescens subsp. venezuelensis]
MLGPKVITCTGYGGTGSSVVSDLLKEFSNVYSFGNFEFRFLQDPHGLRDLDYGIVQNNNRLTTSYHINNYIKYVDFLSKSNVYSYERFFNKKFKEITDEYLRNIIDIEWNGFWHQDIIDEKPFGKFIYYLERFYQKKILGINEGSAKIYSKIFNKNMYYSYPRENFYIETRKYLRNLINASNYDSKEYVIFDQLIPPNDTNHYLKYFDDLKVIIIDRDPRDLYLLNKCLWDEKWIPTGNIHNYINWFKILREHQKFEQEDSERIFRLSFEDFIYKYDETVQQVCKFCCIESSKHTNKHKYFDPKISINNTNLKIKYPEYNSEISFIEKELAEFCYNFPHK